ncbi:MAG: Ubiquinone/menaquinone biosynthesis C-methyltransferase UbiE [Phycisphaerae bacterium]|nr:Ubiquinone/menaquinone biosynthesis C-methyltransferase UbiE [Phycisphaerae bacterium]
MLSALLNGWYRVCYTLWLPFYDLLVRPYSRLRRRAIKLLDLKPGERALIVGAGTGMDLKHLKPVPKITAIDLTPVMLWRLRRRARRRGLEVDARVMDALAMTFPDGSFDAVILHLILAVVPDPARCLAESARVLRPGGRAVVLDKFIRDDRRFRPILWLANLPLKLLGTNVNRRLGPLLEGTGLRIVRQEPAGLGGFVKIVLLRKEGPA